MHHNRVQAPWQPLALQVRNIFERIASELSDIYPSIMSQSQLGEYGTNYRALFSWLSMREGAVELIVEVKNEQSGSYLSCSICSVEGLVFDESNPVKIEYSYGNFQTSVVHAYVEQYFAERKGLIVNELRK